MEDFLEFINSSDKEVLSGLPGSNSKLADQVIGARPFTTMEDVSRVKALTPEIAAGWQAEFERLKKEDRVIEEEKTVADAAVSVTPGSESQPGSRRTVRILTTILVIVLILAAFAAAVYYGVPYFYEKVLNPLESNTSRVSELANTHKTDIKRLEEEIGALQTQVAALELRADDIESSIDAHSATLAQLEDMQAALQSDLEKQKTEILAQMNEQLILTRSLELLSRSRLYLSQSNYGLAKTDVAEARNLLYSLLELVAADEVDGLKVVISRLDLALKNLPEYPVVAVYDVDIAWKLLVDGLPNVPDLAVTPAVEAPTQSVEPSEVPQETQSAEVTQTPGE